MKALIQRVTSASVIVSDDVVGSIGPGLLVLLGVERHDTQVIADRLIDKVLSYRVFADQQQKMNRSLLDIGGDLLLVSQFTLAADTSKGLRPGLSSAAAPALARELYDYAVERLSQRPINLATGIFAADMKVSLCNDGPVTFLLEARDR